MHSVRICWQVTIYLRMPHLCKIFERALNLGISSRRFPLLLALSASTATKPPAELPPRPRKLHRRPRNNSEKTTIHGGIIIHPIEAAKDIHPGGISQPVTVADAVLQSSPYESLRSYNLSVHQKVYTDLIGQINKNIVGHAESSIRTRDSYASTSLAGRSAGSNGTVGDLRSEPLLAARKANMERWGS
ncbi:hypothetical protein HOY80DRAFT_1097184 [Tuber brumale]|nr:hypothetical protein HOY80DRAFT_1097184 [Tuber brumale]